MKIFNCIIGIFCIFASVYCIWFPGITFLKAGWIITTLLCLLGGCVLFNVMTKKNNSKEDKWALVKGLIALLGGIISAGLSTLVIFKPGISLIADLIAIYIFIFWLIVSGISSIVVSVTSEKATVGHGWIITLILGILTLLSGIYGMFHVILIGQTIGFILGILLMIYGIRLITSIFEKYEEE